MAVLKKRSDEWSPLRDIMVFRDEMDRLFENFFSPWGLRRRRVSGEITWAPEVDVYEDENNVIVEAEIPGLKAEELDISVTGNTITLRGEKKGEKEKKAKNYHLLERTYGSFERVIELPTEVEAPKAKAKLKNGVLEVVLPKVAEAKPKQIKVEVK
ncbi:Hsp20/alpha crystallin family protein [Candidatus Calescamantes bacterium]|nr:Hsp20/alpha crystallin family protein [Candidatus Calescamantes bacterium]